MVHKSSTGSGIVGFILGVLACLAGVYYASGTTDEDELRRLREENRILRELSDTRQEQIDEIHRVLNKAAAEWGEGEPAQ